jgi:P27 family predicted phage terminase small subunit
MAINGRPPKPTRLRVLDGNPGRRPINQREPKPVGGPEKPAFITGAAAAEWDRVIASTPPGLLTAADSPTLVILATALALFRAALAQVAREGMMSVGSLGQEVPHPMVAVLARQTELVLRAGDRLGLSPQARTRLAMPETGGGKFEGLLGVET